MKTGIIISISVVITVLAVLLMIGASTSGGRNRQKESRLTRNRLTYSSRDKAPYGSYVPFNVMRHFF